MNPAMFQALSSIACPIGECCAVPDEFRVHCVSTCFRFAGERDAFGASGK
jgi:hypothetical protein